MSTVLDAYDTWQRFRMLHPLSREPFVDTPENRRRWLYHIDIADSMARLDAIRTADSLSPKIKSRSVSEFHEMPAYTRHIYGCIADCFLGIQVYRRRGRLWSYKQSCYITR